MSAKETRRVVRKAVTDETFRKLLFRNPGQALSGFDLTKEERKALQGLPAEPLEAFAEGVDERISFSVLSFTAAAFGREGGRGGSVTTVDYLPEWLNRLVEALDINGIRPTSQSVN